jgi:hypothetical protein
MKAVHDNGDYHERDFWPSTAAAQARAAGQAFIDPAR